MRWNFAHILNKSLIRPISYENSLWSLSKTKVFEAQTFVQLGCEFIQNMAKFHRIAFGCLFIFYHILEIYSWLTYKLKFLLPILKQPNNYHNCCHINHKHNPFSCFKRRFFFYIIYQTCFMIHLF